MGEFYTLLNIAKRKSLIDQQSSWSGGSEIYLNEIKKEIDEVIEETTKGRGCYLEDELGDVLWDYLNALVAFEKEKGINPLSVLERACRKYEERVGGLESGESWDEVKERQSQRLQSEHSVRLDKV